MTTGMSFDTAAEDGVLARSIAKPSQRWMGREMQVKWSITSQTETRREINIGVFPVQTGVASLSIVLVGRP